ncbi:MAG: 2-oxo acid dehydrogenase subunit E2 [Clostridia bacterium]|nr:2-oxo acid dehydrogenase subunit E2 [Clostridia bacterium]
MKRKDGTRVKNLDMMYSIIPYVMEKRYDAMNAITVHLPYQPMQDYIRKKHKEGVDISHLCLIIAAFVRTIGEYEMLNHFIVNKKIYKRDGIWVGMVVLRPGGEESTMTKVRFEPTDNIFEVNDKMMKMITENRKAVGSNSTDKLMKFLLGVPGLVNFGVKFLKFLDRHNMMPKAVIDASPMHVTMTISNLASIRTNHIYHHIYEFGTTSMLATMGNSEYVPKKVGGEIVFERMMPIGLVMDERIASGSYFAQAFRTLERYIKNPELLEVNPHAAENK